jgi:hypothetical protein
MIAGDTVDMPSAHEVLVCLSYRAPPVAIDRESKAAFAEGVTRFLMRWDDTVGERRGTRDSSPLIGMTHGAQRALFPNCETVNAFEMGAGAETLAPASATAC